MGDAMVTGRIAREKKNAGNAVLAASGLSASQAINLLYDKLIEQQGVEFLRPEDRQPTDADWAQAAAFIDSLSSPHASRQGTGMKSTGRIRVMRRETLVGEGELS